MGVNFSEILIKRFKENLVRVYLYSEEFELSEFELSRFATVMIQIWLVEFQKHAYH